MKEGKDCTGRRRRKRGNVGYAEEKWRHGWYMYGKGVEEEGEGEVNMATRNGNDSERGMDESNGGTERRRMSRRGREECMSETQVLG